SPRVTGFFKCGTRANPYRLILRWFRSAQRPVHRTAAQNSVHSSGHSVSASAGRPGAAYERRDRGDRAIRVPDDDPLVTDLCPVSIVGVNRKTSEFHGTGNRYASTVS